MIRQNVLQIHATNKRLLSSAKLQISHFAKKKYKLLMKILERKGCNIKSLWNASYSIFRMTKCGTYFNSLCTIC